jgi:uncharacterized protein (TIGR02466 family)
MNLNRIELFPTLIHVINEFLSPHECDLIISYAKQLQGNPHLAIPENGISSHGSDYSFIDDVELNVKLPTSIKSRLKEAFNLYANDAGYPQIELSNSWINFQYPDSQLIKHTHPNSIISGALYLNVDEDSSKIYFYNPNPYVSFTQYKDVNNYSCEFQWFKPVNGDLILFPSWMAHGSNGERNKTSERVVISVNS